jgi:lipopolysaccharide export system protein LptA
MEEALKSIVLVSMLLVSAVAPQVRAVKDVTRVVVTADSVQHDGNTIHLRGHVQVRQGTSVITAERADLPARVELDAGPAVIQFKGDVRLTIEGVAPLSVVRR